MFVQQPYFYGCHQGMDLDADDLIVGMQVSSQGEAVLIVSEKGLGKANYAGRI